MLLLIFRHLRGCACVYYRSLSVHQLCTLCIYAHAPVCACIRTRKIVDVVNCNGIQRDFHVRVCLQSMTASIRAGRPADIDIRTRMRCYTCTCTCAYVCTAARPAVRSVPLARTTDAAPKAWARARDARYAVGRRKPRRALLRCARCRMRTCACLCIHTCAHDRGCSRLQSHPT